jgi:hypothetical protein
MQILALAGSDREIFWLLPSAERDFIVRVLFFVAIVSVLTCDFVGHVCVSWQLSSTPRSSMEDRDDLLSEEPEPAAAAEKTMTSGADDAATVAAQAAEWKRKEEEATRREVQVRNKNTPKHRPRFLRTKRKTLCKSVFPSVKSALCLDLQRQSTKHAIHIEMVACVGEW